LRRVRVCDALLANLRDYSERCDEEDRVGLSPLADAWGTQRTRQVDALIAFTSSDGHQDWMDATTAFATNDAAKRAARCIEAGRPSHVRHIVRSAIARHLDHIRSYDVLPDPPTPEQIHGLRVAIRRLRHTVEALQDVLPPEEARTWLQACAAAQDAYGAIHDAHQAATHALQLVAQNHPDRPRGGVYPPRVAVRGVAAYAEAQRRVVAARLVGWRDYLKPFL
jgi:CHAD domain-containing protein